MMKSEVRSKKENNRLFQAGAYGTKLRTWGNLEELQASGYQGLVGVRYLEPGSKWCRYMVPPEGLCPLLAEYVRQGARLDLFVFGEMAPDDDLLIQGEAAQFEHGWYLFYSTAKAKMRDALKYGQHLHGFAVPFVLREYLTPSSYEDFMALFDAYKDPVVEFSTYRQTLGEIPGRNTIIWEVRTTY